MLLEKEACAPNWLKVLPGKESSRAARSLDMNELAANGMPMAGRSSEKRGRRKLEENRLAVFWVAE